MKKKLLISLLSAFMIFINMPTTVYAASANPGTITVTKSDGSPAIEGTDETNHEDYYWELNGDEHVLQLCADNLTVSGTDTTNDVWVIADTIVDSDSDGSILFTINNLNLQGDVEIGTGSVSVTIQVKGNNSITGDEVNFVGISASGFLKLIGDGNLTITAADSATLGSGIQGNSGIDIDMSGTLLINAQACGIMIQNNYLNITNNISKIIISSRVDILNTELPVITMGTPGTFGLLMGSDVQMLGAAEQNANEANITTPLTLLNDAIPVIDATSMSFPGTVMFKKDSSCDHSSATKTNLLIPTASAAGCKEYYYCSSCSKYFSDSGYTSEITDITTWKASGGDGYIAPLTTPNNIYSLIGGVDMEYDVNTVNNDVLFTAESADFSKFVCVLMDGNLVSSSNYTAESGSIDVTLKQAYIKSLSNGSHELTVVATDGHAKGPFTISGQTPPSPSSNPDSTPRYKIPNTGVEGTPNNNHLLLKLSSLSILAIGTYIVIKKKKDN